jgi:hypothetical protein
MQKGDLKQIRRAFMIYYAEALQKSDDPGEVGVGVFLMEKSPHFALDQALENTYREFGHAK